MFCPKCGLEDKRDNQFCRSCGADLNRVRGAVALPELNVVDPRDEISRVIAAKIRCIESAEDLKTVAEDVLPELEKFLESPAERRFRRMRTGTLLSCIGISVAIAALLVAIGVNEPGVLAGAAAGMIVFFIGISFILNGVFLTMPRPRGSIEKDAQPPEVASPVKTGPFQIRPVPASGFSSVTEGTTRHLEQTRTAKTDEL